MLVFAAQAAERVAEKPVAASPFSLGEVRLLDGPFKQAETVNRAYLLSLDPDRFLFHFRVNAGLPTTARPYGGWENSDWDFRGHILGHYLTACSLMAAHGGEPEFQRRVDYIVAELAKCQATLATRASHAGFLDPQPETVFDRLDRGEGNVGVPYYTMHKTLAGLLDAHNLAGSAQALDVARQLGDWFVFRIGRLTVEQVQKSLRIEHGGINESMAELAAATGDPAYLRAAESLNHRLLFEPLSRGLDPLGPPTSDPMVPGGLSHGNTQVPKALGAAREYELTGDPMLRTVASNFWDFVVHHRTWVFGGNTDREHFFARDTEAQHLTQITGEGCNTYNMLKLTRHLFSWSPAAGQMDFYERALYNHILATQRPDDGRLIYFMPLQPGFRKLYGSAENTFWCCTGSGMENHAKYSDSIYFHDERSLYVNLFVASELQWKEKGLTVRQDTAFPSEERSRLTIHTRNPQRLALNIRHPAWCNRLEVTVNGGAPSSDLAAGSYLTIDREWRDGDRIELRLPMTLRTETLPGDASRVAFLYGPLVLAGNLGRDGIDFKPAEYADNGKDVRGPRVPEEPAAVPGLVSNRADLLAHVRAVAGKSLTFATSGIGRPNDVTLVPLFRIVDESFTIYWQLFDEAGWVKTQAETGPKEAQRQAAWANVLDAVWSGSTAMEAAHGVDATSAPLVSSRLKLYRDATRGSVAWKLRAASRDPVRLRVGYADGAHTACDILVDGQKIAEERPSADGAPRRSSDDDGNPAVIRVYEIPAQQTAGKPVVEIRFAGHSDLGTAQIVFCELARRTGN